MTNSSENPINNQELMEGKETNSSAANNKFEKKKILLLVASALALFFCAALFYRVSASEVTGKSKMILPFYAKEWQVMDQIWKEPQKLSSQDVSLYINALWQQGRALESLKILENPKTQFPKELQPYATMLRILGYERSAKYEEAYRLAQKQWDEDPKAIHFYLTYALARLSKRVGDTDSATRWFREMAYSSNDRKEMYLALQELMKLETVSADDAGAMLFLNSNNTIAKKIVMGLSEDHLTPRSKAAKGVGLYTQKEYSKALPLLQQGFNDRFFGEDARYYYGLAAYGAGRYGEALEAWVWGARYGNEFPQRSIQKLRTLSKKYGQERIVGELRHITQKRDDPEIIQDAFRALIAISSPQERQVIEEEALRRLPSSALAAQIYWDRGYRQWKNGNYLLAKREWEKAENTQPNDPELSARLLYWRIRSHTLLGDLGKVQSLKDKMQRLYPFEYYASVLGVKPLFQEDVDYAERLSATQTHASLLEQWGFVPYALGELLQENSAQANYQASQLAEWSGNSALAMKQAALYYKKRGENTPLPLEVAQRLYPRVFEESVNAASKKTGVHPAVIWGIMRQESLFNPVAQSGVGAYGLMQLMPPTAKDEARKLGLHEKVYLTPDGNILLGANHIKGLLSTFGDTHRALAAYNAGGSPVRRWSEQGISDPVQWVEEIRYPETRGYVKSVMGNIAVYRHLYDRVDTPKP